MEGFSNSGRAGRRSYGPPRPSMSGLRKRPSDKSGTVRCMVGGAEGSARASVYPEEHRALMDTVIRRISSAESGLYEAVRMLLTGFEVREMMYLLTEPHI